jgi:undecaprenyl-diphosphatase
MPPMSAGAVFVNPRSGRGDLDAAALEPHFPGAAVSERAAEGLAGAVRAAVDAGVSFVGIAGGDGSMRCAAAVLAGTGVPLLAVPAGTRNHFSREVGIETVEDAARAAVAGSVTVVDVGDVNGRCFVNNAGIGFYAALVRERTRHERRLPRAAADLAAAWAQARHGHRFPVRIDGRRHRAWVVFVGNGCYGDTITDLGVRRALDEGTLDVRVLRADAPFARTRAVAALVLGRLGRSPLLVQQLSETVEVDVPGRTAVDVALDGEVVRVPTPLQFRVVPRALTVLVPPS